MGISAAAPVLWVASIVLGERGAEKFVAVPGTLAALSISAFCSTERLL